MPIIDPRPVVPAVFGGEHLDSAMQSTVAVPEGLRAVYVTPGFQVFERTPARQLTSADDQEKDRREAQQYAAAAVSATLLASTWKHNEIPLEERKRLMMLHILGYELQPSLFDRCQTRVVKFGRNIVARLH